MNKITFVLCFVLLLFGCAVTREPAQDWREYIDVTLFVNDKLPCYSLSDVDVQEGDYEILQPALPEEIHFKKSIDLRNGDRLVCVDVNGCSARVEDFVILRGEVERHTSFEEFVVDKVLSVGDEVDLDDIDRMNVTIVLKNGGMINNVRVPPRIQMVFGETIDLKDETRYVCISEGEIKKLYGFVTYVEGGCTIRLDSSVITQGSVEVHKKRQFGIKKMLHVKDKLPCRSLEDIQGGDYEVIRPMLLPELSFKEWIELKDGTRLTCVEDGGCVVGLGDYVVKRGTIKVRRDVNAVPDLSP